LSRLRVYQFDAGTEEARRPKPKNGATNMEAIENATSETLKSSYANAAATACLALGHGKSQRNEAEAKRYAEELQARGVEPLEYFDAAEMGTFNGSGSV